MRKIAGLVLVLFLVQNLMASPLVFKTTKEIPKKEKTFIADVDTLKYKQIRIKIENLDKRYVESRQYREYKIYLYAVEAEEEIFLVDGDGYITFSTLVDTPPTKLRIYIDGIGKFRVYIWGTQ